ncbi:hypothetical protein SO802_028572 [Lithocarpus litseifolius]|uniref:Endonuclease/exonuclease/phosphatase domain-containing protein n=1 Tax=Lithocarpus litseifolius TaxID=425828 RepID=A0AAW2BS56_9ROSI
MLWNNLSTVASTHNLPWIIAGDFNELLSSEDKLGGRPISLYKANIFKECLDACNMADLGFQGPRYTWTNKHDLCSLIQERLDRFFANPDWCVLYPEAQVTHLPRSSSDHCPVLMELEPQPNIRLNRPFRFHSFWLSDNPFPKIVQNAWSTESGLYSSIKKFKRDASEWNRVHFGNIFAKKKRILARISGIQRSMAERSSSFLINLEKQLQAELLYVMN